MSPARRSLFFYLYGAISHCCRGTFFFFLRTCSSLALLLAQVPLKSAVYSDSFRRWIALSDLCSPVELVPHSFSLEGSRFLFFSTPAALFFTGGGGRPVTLLSHRRLFLGMFPFFGDMLPSKWLLVEHWEAPGIGGNFFFSPGSPAAFTHGSRI